MAHNKLRRDLTTILNNLKENGNSVSIDAEDVTAILTRCVTALGGPVIETAQTIPTGTLVIAADMYERARVVAFNPSTGLYKIVPVSTVSKDGALVTFWWATAADLTVLEPSAPVDVAPSTVVTVGQDGDGAHVVGGCETCAIPAEPSTNSLATPLA